MHDAVVPEQPDRVDGGEEEIEFGEERERGEVAAHVGLEIVVGDVVHGHGVAEGVGLVDEEVVLGQENARDIAHLLQNLHLMRIPAEAALLVLHLDDHALMQ